MNSCLICDLICSPKLISKRDTNTMNSTLLADKIKSFFNPKTLLDCARQCRFLQRSRQIVPMTLMLSFIETLGSQSKANIADIHRKYQTLSGMPIEYKPFHNQIKKLHCADFFRNCFKKVMGDWVLQSLKLTSLSSGAAFPFTQVKLHDGCSFAIHAGLQGTYPGRFKKTHSCSS